VIDKKKKSGIMSHKFKKTKARKRRVHSGNSYREPPVAAKEERQNEWKMVLELRTERGNPLGCDGNARDSVRVSAKARTYGGCICEDAVNKGGTTK
jgi:hypothetical protein